MAKTQDKKEAVTKVKIANLKQRLGGLSLKRMQITTQAQAINERMNALVKEIVATANEIMALESKNED